MNSILTSTVAYREGPLYGQQDFKKYSKLWRTVRDYSTFSIFDLVTGMTDTIPKPPPNDHEFLTWSSLPPIVSWRLRYFGARVSPARFQRALRSLVVHAGWNRVLVW